LASIFYKEERHEEANATLIWHQYFTKKKRPDSKNGACSSVAPPRLRAMLAVVPRLALPPLVLLLRWLLLLPLLLVPLLAFGCLAECLAACCFVDALARLCTKHST